MPAAIEFQDVSKRFTLHHARPQSVLEALLGFFRRDKTSDESLWVLKNVSFALEQGKTYGFIGANGAGKSTALKLIARIITPTTGLIDTSGRVGALLELGAGFHPDLTGRENIYLNGAVLGLRRQDIARKLDAIIDFAELTRFIDVPVKYYSSGMYVRLGFSVAVHTEPDVLLVDEVLSVGDARFQRKCLERVAQLRESGATIVMVSHGMDSIQSLCDEALWFHQGIVAEHGEVTDVLMAYANYVAREGAEASDALAGELHDRRWGNGKIRIVKVQVMPGPERTHFETGSPVRIRLHYEARERVKDPSFGLAIYHQNGAHITGPNTNFGGLDIPYVEGAGVVNYDIPKLNLLMGDYRISVAAVNRLTNETYDYHDRVYPLRVHRGACQEQYGLIYLDGAWSFQNQEG